MHVARVSIARWLAIALFAAAPALAFPAEGEPPYEASLLRLSEILGALHYLRPLCGAADEQELWRGRMDSLLAAEAPSPDRRAALVTAFNRSYSSFATLYRSCTPAAATAIERYVAEGAKLSQEITTRYGR